MLLRIDELFLEVVSVRKLALFVVISIIDFSGLLMNFPDLCVFIICNTDEFTQVVIDGIGKHL